MELVLSLQEHALVVLDMGLKLIITSHGTPKQAILLTSLLPLVVHKLVAELKILLLDLVFGRFRLMDLFLDMKALIMALPVMV